MKLSSIIAGTSVFIATTALVTNLNYNRPVIRESEEMSFSEDLKELVSHFGIATHAPYECSYLNHSSSKYPLTPDRVANPNIPRTTFPQALTAGLFAGCFFGLGAYAMADENEKKRTKALRGY